ncbi:MAG TPA: hypothetical protein VM262_01675 [Acidimicrobiales bacterium]|nr:hypothetical protein [Acidimicrobiales bacterium]
MRRVTVVALAVAGALAATVAYAAAGGSGSVTVVDGAVPTAYRITYEVVTGGVPSTEVHTVRRPFQSRIEVGRATRVSDAGVLATTSDGASWVRIEVPLALAGGDLRPDAVLDDALAAGVVEVVGTRRVAGRPCRVVAFGGPVGGGTLTPVGAVAGESVEACIDGAGLVLAESWSVAGVVRREREAVRVEVGEVLGPVGDDVFGVPASASTLSFGDGGGSVRAVAPGEDPGFTERWQATVPAGFEHAGRWHVLPPAVGAPVDPTVPRAADVALVTDVWVRGPDLVLVDQGAVVGGGPPPWDDRPWGEPVDLGALGPGELVFDLRLSEVRVVRGDGGFVRVAGTLPPAELVAVARSLELEEEER